MVCLKEKQHLLVPNTEDDWIFQNPMDSLSFRPSFRECNNVQPWQFYDKMKGIEYLGADMGGNSDSLDFVVTSAGHRNILTQSSLDTLNFLCMKFCPPLNKGPSTVQDLIEFPIHLSDDRWRFANNFLPDRIFFFTRTCWMIYLLTYSMEESPSWEANWFCS